MTTPRWPLTQTVAASARTTASRRRAAVRSLPGRILPSTFSAPMAPQAPAISAIFLRFWHLDCRAVRFGHGSPGRRAISLDEQQEAGDDHSDHRQAGVCPDVDWGRGLLDVGKAIKDPALFEADFAANVPSGCASVFANDIGYRSGLNGGLSKLGPGNYCSPAFRDVLNKSSSPRRWGSRTSI